ncbi:Nucleolar protein 58 [Glutinoglossum americanum]|uniref:Nucleolar protein 58 n=1 Tax=Glutinoglossum americanum TaxID=1670608 RepID=A0A9P8KX23_9PEZI|nr:Nucleolar protein 58 [Glutinoglossum americanum]
MTLFILTETSAGYALLKASSKKILKRKDSTEDAFSEQDTCNLLKLKHFQKFDKSQTATNESAAIIEGKVSPLLASLLDNLKREKAVSLAVADPKLGNAINKIPSLKIEVISDASTADVYRAIRTHLSSLIPGLFPSDVSTMTLGLAHSLSRHKLKFSPDKVDIMIVQAIGLLDDLDKELNTYAMRVKEWYGWHFPEMGRIVNDNLAYARVILNMGMRSNAVNTDLAAILPEEIEAAVKAAAEVSMGTEITEEDLVNIKLLAEQVVEFTEYRQSLSNYLSARMTAIAPNLTTLVGELVGARLIAHAGSLMNLAKSPASTIQILGAEKALFRALKTKHDTPKYGLIFHASLIGQATGRNKGKIARMLATKAAIGIRVDALADWSAHGEGKGADVTEEERSALAVESRAKIERRLRALEGKPLLSKGVAVGPSGKFGDTPGKWEVKEARKYNPDADGLVGDEPAASTIKKPKEKRRRKDRDGDIEMAEGTKDRSSEAEDEEIQDAEPITPNASFKSKSEPNGTDSKRRSKKEAAELDETNYGVQAKEVGLSVKKYKKKLDQGKIEFNADGTPVLVSKKSSKRSKREKSDAEGSEKERSEKLRKRSKEDSGEKREKSKKKRKEEKGSSAA